MISHDYVTMKLTNGDNIICLLVGDDDDTFTVMYPIQMKAVRVEINEQAKEVMTGSPWCSFTDDNIFNIYKQDVLLLKRLNESTITYFKKMVDLSEVEDVPEQELVNPNVEHINEMSEDTIFIEGNDTIN